MEYARHGGEGAPVQACTAGLEGGALVTGHRRTRLPTRLPSGTTLLSGVLFHHCTVCPVHLGRQELRPCYSAPILAGRGSGETWALVSAHSPAGPPLWACSPRGSAPRARMGLNHLRCSAPQAQGRGGACTLAQGRWGTVAVSAAVRLEPVRSLRLLLSCEMGSEESLPHRALVRTSSGVG